MPVGGHSTGFLVVAKLYNGNSTPVTGSFLVHKLSNQLFNNL